MKRRIPLPLVPLLALIGATACADDPVAPAEGIFASQAPAQGYQTLVAMESDVSANLQAVWGTDRSNVVAVGSGGNVQHFDGEGWTRRPIGTVSGVNGVWGSAADDVWAVGGLGALLHFDGAGWTLVDRLESDTGARWQLFGIWGSGADDVWAVGNNGASHHYDGSSWTYVGTPTSEVLRSVWGGGPDDVFAVGDAGTILHFDGEGWSAAESPTDIRLNAVHGRSGDDVFAAGSFGMILHFDGEAWREDPQARRVTSAHIRDLWSDRSGNVFAAAWGGTLLLHDGRGWEVIRTGTDVNLEGGWTSADGRLYTVGAGGSVYRGGRGTGAGDTPPGQEEVPIWPLAGTATFDADSVHSPYGPRMLPSRYDFHAGVDLPAPRGTPIYAVLSGEVIETREWDGVSTGAGNAVTVRHPSGEATSYLHLDEILVEEGDLLTQGDVLGTVGSTGATYPHLHLGYFRTLNFSNVDERLSYNPLQLLRHNPRRDRVGVSFTADGVTLDVPLQRMTIQTIELHGGEDSRVVDYPAIVQRGVTPRREPVQFGVRIDVERPSGGRFDLTLTPEDFPPDRVIVTDIHGQRVLDVVR